MRQITRVGAVKIVLMDSISEVRDEDTGAIVIAGSHAGANGWSTR